MRKLSLNNKILPQNDFYEHVNSNWIKKNKIPNDEVYTGTFKILRNKNDTIIKKIIEDIAKKSSVIDKTSDKIRTLYNQGMNTKSIDKLGIIPIESYLNHIDNENNITTLLTYLHKIGITAFFGVTDNADKDNSNKTILYIYQGGVGLPNKLYYFDKDKANIRDQYKIYMKKQLLNFKFPTKAIAKTVNTIYNLEKKLVSNFYTPEEYRDVHRTYNSTSIKDMANIISSIDFKKYLIGIGLKNVDKIKFNVDNYKYFKELHKLLKSEKLADIKLYFKWRFINKFSSYLNKKIELEQFNFYGKQLSGQNKIKPRWERIIDDVDDHLGEAIGQIYVKKHFSNKKRKLINEMIINIKSVFKERLKKLEWMTESTKKKAIIKLQKMNFKIGHPKKWENFDKLRVKPSNSYLENIIECFKYEFNYMISKCYQPSDKNRWYMTPHTVNAYYDPTQNEMAFPAGIFQYPFFDEKNMALSYGSIGQIIGHEITHGFDDQGSHYNATGELENWWNETDRTKFKKQTNSLVKQYDSYKFHNVHVNGSLTLGENIADLGGLIITYYAFQKYMKKNKVKNLNNNQEKQLFYFWANMWKTKMTKKALINRINTDPHSPAKVRVNGVVTNVTEFYDIFNVQPNHKLYKKEDDRIKIW